MYMNRNLCYKNKYSKNQRKEVLKNKFHKYFTNFAAVKNSF